MYMYSQMFNANDSAVHEKWAKFQTKTQKTQKLILYERFGDPYRRLEDFYHYSGRLQDKLGELVYLSVKFVG